MQMISRIVNQWSVVTTLAMLSIGVWINPTQAQQHGPEDYQPGVEVLTRGPVHEAFAETVAFNPEPGIVVPMTPREIIEEVPPDYKPDGINVTWIPGYWAWDDERNDYLWISGIWRDLPPGRQWVPGYWGQSNQGYQWVAGYWADAAAHEIVYYPEPPESLEIGPNLVAPALNQAWVPGSWLWYQDRYAWRPGYWAAGRANWVWVPAQYIWTPRGYVFSEGYWDYPIVRRGVIFAPVYFHRAVYTRRDYFYTPSIVINLAVFSDQLFVRPRYRHYYFGDYYDTRYRETGFFASFSYHSSRYGYDPIYAHRRWQHRRDVNWDRYDKDIFAHRRDVVTSRPPRTLQAQRELFSRAARPDERRIEAAASFNLLARSKDNPLRFQKIEQTEREQLTKRGGVIQNIRGERQKLETAAASTPTQRPAATRSREPARVKLPKPVIVSKPVNQLRKDQAPPRRHNVPAPDLKIEPRAKVADGKPDARREPPARRADPPAQASKDQSRPKKAEPKKDSPETEPKGKSESESKGKSKDDKESKDDKKSNDDKESKDKPKKKS
jgi:hypothetical protein